MRYLGSGSLLPLADGRYGMFFGGGNCLVSDAFHFIGYAETVNRVTQPSDLLSRHVVNGLETRSLIHRARGPGQSGEEVRDKPVKR